MSFNDLLDVTMYSRVDNMMLVSVWMVKLFRMVIMNNIVLDSLEWVMHVVSNYKCTCKDLN